MKRQIIDKRTIMCDKMTNDLKTVTLPFVSTVILKSCIQIFRTDLPYPLKYQVKILNLNRIIYLKTSHHKLTWYDNIDVLHCYEQA